MNTNAAMKVECHIPNDDSKVVALIAEMQRLEEEARQLSEAVDECCTALCPATETDTHPPEACHIQKTA